MRLVDVDTIFNGELLVVNTEAYDVIQSIIEKINKAPTVDAVPVRHGYWIGKPIAGYATVRCSVCGDVFRGNTGRWNYCPNCGAKMGGGKNETNAEC